MKLITSITVAIVLACFSFTATAQDTGAKDATKQETKAAMKATAYSVSCSPECGFSVKSHDKAEVTTIVINHAKSAHNKTMTEADVKPMMKSEPMEPKKETK